MELEKKKTTLILPQDLLIQIVLRLPVKCLLRFKCVSKSWFSLISGSYFARLHFELAATTGKQGLLQYFPLNSEIRSLDINAPLHDDSASATIKLKFLFPKPDSHAIIAGSCRGFIVLHYFSNFYIWNPTTGVHKQIPHSPIRSKLTFYSQFLYGFGYDSSTDDYLIILGCTSTNLMKGDWVTRIQLFSLKTNTWKDLESPRGTSHEYCSNVNGKVGLLFNGGIHWFAFRADAKVKVIIVFDLMKRSFSEIAPPHDIDCPLQLCALRIFRGSLSLCAPGHANTIRDIWVMEEYKVQSSWKRYTPASPRVTTKFLSPICDTKSGDIVAIDGGQLMKFNDKGELLEHRSHCESTYGCNVVMYNESLLSLPKYS